MGYIQRSRPDYNFNLNQARTPVVDFRIIDSNTLTYKPHPIRLLLFLSYFYFH